MNQSQPFDLALSQPMGDEGLAYLFSSTAVVNAAVVISAVVVAVIIFSAVPVEFIPAVYFNSMLQSVNNNPCCSLLIFLSAVCFRKHLDLL